MIKAFWIIYDLVILSGTVISVIRAYKEYRKHTYGKQNFADLVRRLTDKGTDRETAIKLQTARKRAALINCIGYGVMAFCFNYVFIDIIFTHIIGG